MKNKRFWIQFNYDDQGRGDFVLFDYEKELFRIPSRTGSMHFRPVEPKDMQVHRDGGPQQELRLVNSIKPGFWYVINPPVPTSELGMWIGAPHNGWKIRLFLQNEKRQYEFTHFLLHPDGGAGGTLGCIGFQKTNAHKLRDWFNWYFRESPGTIIPLAVNQDKPIFKKEEVPVEKFKKAARSRTFYACLGIVLVKFLENQGIIPSGIANMLEGILFPLGLVGARNVKRK